MNTYKNQENAKIRELSAKLQQDVNVILSDIAEYIFERSDDENEITHVHFDVDMILRNMHIPRRVIRQPKARVRGSMHASIVNPAPRPVMSKHTIPEYNSEFIHMDKKETDRRPFGKLNNAARFVFGNM